MEDATHDMALPTALFKDAYQMNHLAYKNFISEVKISTCILNNNKIFLMNDEKQELELEEYGTHALIEGSSKPFIRRTVSVSLGYLSHAI